MIKFMSSDFRLSLLFLVFLLSSQIIVAQVDLYQEVSQNEFDANMNNGQRNKYDKIKRNRMYKTVKPIKIGNIRSLINRNVIKFKIPGYNKIIEAKASSVQTHSLDKFVWIGNMVDNSGTVLFNVSDGKVTGNIYIGNDIFEIMDLGNNKNLILNVDERQYTEHECARPSPTRLDNRPSNTLTTRSVSNVCNTIRVLVLFTPAADLLTRLHLLPT